MPSNAVTNSNTDFTDSPGSRTGESTRPNMDLMMDLMMDKRAEKSSPSSKAGKPGMKRKQFLVESCSSLRPGVASSGAGRPSMAPAHNGDVGGHRDRTSDACFPKQEKRDVENGIPRDGSQSRSPSQENGFLPSQEDQDSDKDKDDSSTPPRKKRGRRKLERPTKYVEHKEEDGAVSVKSEGDRGRLRGGVGWEISLRQRPVPRITFQAGDPYYISKRTREEWLAKWKSE
ncbi:DNA (cytosine-5)-methyltransferase 3A-like, partial [Brachionichthys hirsutus]